MMFSFLVGRQRQSASDRPAIDPKALHAALTCVKAARDRYADYNSMSGTEIKKAFNEKIKALLSELNPHSDTQLFENKVNEMRATAEFWDNGGITNSILEYYQKTLYPVIKKAMDDGKDGTALRKIVQRIPGFPLVILPKDDEQLLQNFKIWVAAMESLDKSNPSTINAVKSAYRPLWFNTGRRFNTCRPHHHYYDAIKQSFLSIIQQPRQLLTMFFKRFGTTGSQPKAKPVLALDLDGSFNFAHLYSLVFAFEELLERKLTDDEIRYTASLLINAPIDHSYSNWHADVIAWAITGEKPNSLKTKEGEGTSEYKQSIQDSIFHSKGMTQFSQTIRDALNHDKTSLGTRVLNLTQQAPFYASLYLSSFQAKNLLALIEKVNGNARILTATTEKSHVMQAKMLPLLDAMLAQLTSASPRQKPEIAKQIQHFFTEVFWILPPFEKRDELARQTRGYLQDPNNNIVIITVDDAAAWLDITAAGSAESRSIHFPVTAITSKNPKAFQVFVMNGSLTAKQLEQVLSTRDDIAGCKLSARNEARQVLGKRM